ncbi:MULTISPECIES: hypothetical protein [Rhizobium]|uniref:hypothetical protein n=1 Tax=Rhizobium TaxID=379 RepID=UPI000BE89451|nr:MULTISPECIES: hypothetical protein [Rhizobium]MBY4591672.1 hypothetical protein [Rhizobium redzepovicii]MDF0657914.1 hypothetical protein [Rhizobium sp. BC49]PDS83859.1 hypothetical protein CO654_18180 [Rhizobium sp. L18]TBY42213.1 hypothetical protein E0H54_30345 [Rhizobium leguminosarum bv. viciae]ULJ77045.1 hypothetical protein MF410_13205 [Rhizobium sp. C104]
MIPTIFGGNTGRTQGDIDDKRKQLAYAMLEQGMDASPVQSPWQGAARLAQAGLGGLAIRQQEQEQQAGAGQGAGVSTAQPSKPAPASPGFLSLFFGGAPTRRTDG